MTKYLVFIFLTVIFTSGCSLQPSEKEVLVQDETPPHDESSEIETEIQNDKGEDISDIDPVTKLTPPSFPDIVVHENMTLYIGAIQGRILFYDGTPASKCLVFLFYSGRSSTSRYTYTNEEGYYAFDGVPSSDNEGYGRYEIYPVGEAYLANNDDFIWGRITVHETWPHEKVQVYKRKITTVTTIKIYRQE